MFNIKALTWSTEHHCRLDLGEGCKNWNKQFLMCCFNNFWCFFQSNNWNKRFSMFFKANNQNKWFSNFFSKPKIETIIFNVLTIVKTMYRPGLDHTIGLGLIHQSMILLPLKLEYILFARKNRFKKHFLSQFILQIIIKIQKISDWRVYCRGGRSQDFTQSIPRPRLTQKIQDRSIPLETEGWRLKASIW